MHKHVRHGTTAGVAGIALGVVAFYLMFFIAGNSHVAIAIGIGIVGLLLVWALLAFRRTQSSNE